MKSKVITMKRILPIIVIMGSACPTQAALDYSVSVNQAIPDGNYSGLSSQVSVSGLSGNASVDVSLNISGTWNGDLYAYLTHGDGFAVLLNRVGRTTDDDIGYGDKGFNVTLSDAALVDIHNYGGNSGNLVSGLFQPDGRNVLPDSAYQSTPRTAMLSSFNNVDPNGKWVLYVADVNGGDLHQLNTWSLSFTAVPESGFTGWMAGALCLSILGMHSARRYSLSR